MTDCCLDVVCHLDVAGENSASARLASVHSH